MSNYSEIFWKPNEYYRPDWGDKKIICKPLINTSFKELHDAGWWLTSQARYVPSSLYTKVKFQFNGPAEKPGWPFLIYKGWLKGKILIPPMLLDVLYESDLTPNFSKEPVFNLLPKAKETKEKDILSDDEVLKLRDMNNLLLLKKTPRNETKTKNRNEVHIG